MHRRAIGTKVFAYGLTMLILSPVLHSVPRPVRADGLIYRLPPDGTVAEFRGDLEGVQKFVLPKEWEAKLTPEAKADFADKKLTMKFTVTVSSVGRVTRAGQPCRWIELIWSSVDAKTEEKSDNVLKMLIPEKFLNRDEDPLDGAVLTFFNPKEVDKAMVEPEPGFNRIQYELDRFRPVFPKPLGKVRVLPRKTVVTPAGTFNDCEVIAGATEFDRPLLGEGRWAIKSDWQIALHADAPSGVVELRCRSEGAEFDAEEGVAVQLKTSSTLTLVKIGSNATSVLPDDFGDRKASDDK